MPDAYRSQFVPGFGLRRRGCREPGNRVFTCRAVGTAIVVTGERGGTRSDEIVEVRNMNCKPSWLEPMVQAGPD
jgi:hypothetical protein